MKSRLLKLQFILLTSLLITHCTGVETTSRGLENVAYLEFVGKGYSDGINVIIDDTNEFTANVKREVKKRPTGDKYAIAPGRHVIEIYHNDSLIFRKEIFVSNQETYRINLP